jgi:hypothetical protein
MSNILSIPFKENEKLKAVLDFVDGDIELQTLWKCANVQAIDRLGLNDHGPVHVKIVANKALKLLRMLLERGVQPSIKVNYKKTDEDAEVVVVLASALHDLGMAIIRQDHELYSVHLAQRVLDRYLSKIYQPEEATIMLSEILHAIISHHASMKPHTLEAGIVKVADALDMEQGRARIPYEAGRVNIHSMSALSIEKVNIEEGEEAEKPIIIMIEMSNPAGIFQVDNLLGTKIKDSGLEKYVRIEVVIGKGEQRFVLDESQFRKEP